MRWLWLAAVVAPWSWFLLRDALGAVSIGIAILLPVLVVVIVVALVTLVRPRRVGLVVAASVSLAGVVAVVAPWTPLDAGPVAPGRAVTVASANVETEVRTADALLAVNADVLIVAEMRPGLRPALAAHYPYRLDDVRTADPSVAVYSRLPLGKPQVDDLPGLRVEVAAAGGPFVLYALHVPRPWISGEPGDYQVTLDKHLRILQRLGDRVASERAPVVVAGDLNSVDRAPDYHALVTRGGLIDAMRAGWAAPTSVEQWRPLLARIDHVLVSAGWCGDGPRRFHLPLSDHDGITVSIGPCASR
jgi:endonuclease/exonuclease/phosphatase (EEP) superfamily protein YafD